jgi:hypothetical protein
VKNASKLKTVAMLFTQMGLRTEQNYYRKIPIKRPWGLNIFQKWGYYYNTVFPKSKNQCKYI